MTPTTIYLAGPMTGIRAFNFPRFDEVAERLRAQDWQVSSPAEHDREMGFDPDVDTLDDFDMGAAFRWDMEQVCRCDAIALLPGWEHSSGATIECRLARKLGKDVYEADVGGVLLLPLGTGDPGFQTILDEMAALHARKAADYGARDDPYANVRASEGWGIPAWVGALIRGGDKIQRLKRFSQTLSLRNESAEDSMIDLAVYAVIALRLFREKVEGT